MSFGDVQKAGNTWAATVAKLPWAASTKLHVVGDGATWIAEQARQCLGAKDYLVDFYHVCDYLAAASPKAATSPKWLDTQKRRLKSNRPDKVIRSLEPYVEAEGIPQGETPVRNAMRYLQNRIEQLDYRSAIENGLPTGSGMIGSAHRHVLQDRLKIAGAWWTEQNARNMAALRVARANGEEALHWRN
ncbi:MAG: UPF0236 family protein [Verrucomicrobiota bacterium]